MIIPELPRSLAAFRAWNASDDFPDEGRICYLSGDIFCDFEPEPISSHVALKSDLLAALAKFTDETDHGRYFGDGCRVVNEAADFSTVPDGVYLSYDGVSTGRVHLVPTPDNADFGELLGAPDLVVEIVGPTSVEKDTVVLRDLYHRAGIPEYWLLDAMGEEMVFEILRHAANGYTPQPSADGWVYSPVLGTRFRIDRSQTPIGIWSYHVSVEEE